MKASLHYLRLLVVLASLLGGSGLAPAAELPTPIYQIGDAQGIFIQVPLTQDIYRHKLLRSDLQNLLVLDAEQNPMPYRVVGPAPLSPAIEQPIVNDELLFFPIAVDATPDTLRKLHSEKLQVDAGAVHLTTSDRILSNKTPEFYLLDISKLDHAITGLIIDWDEQEGSQYIELELEATRNLQDWVSLGPSTLVQIIQPQQSLKKNRIDLALARKEYQFLRLRVIRGAEGLRLTKVIAEQAPGQAPGIPLARESWSLSGDLAKEQAEAGAAHRSSKSLSIVAWEFTRSEVTPIDTVAIDFAQTSYGSSGKILSRSAENKDWELEYQGIFFNAQIGSRWQSSDPVKVYSKGDIYWRIELDKSVGDRAQPKLVFAWQPLALQIIGNDKPPFTLAVSAAGNNYHSRQIFNQLATLSSPVWRPANLIALDVRPQVLAAERRAIDWKQYLFWAALLLAVLVLLGFSLRLFRQLNAVTEKL